jgi:hypothetical protein
VDRVLVEPACAQEAVSKTSYRPLVSLVAQGTAIFSDLRERCIGGSSSSSEEDCVPTAQARHPLFPAVCLIHRAAAAHRLAVASVLSWWEGGNETDGFSPEKCRPCAGKRTAISVRVALKCVGACGSVAWRLASAGCVCARVTGGTRRFVFDFVSKTK